MLSDGYLSGRQYDEIEARVLRRVAQAEATRSRAPHVLGSWARVAGAPLAACLMVGLVWVLHRPEPANPALAASKPSAARRGEVHAAPSAQALLAKGDEVGEVGAALSGVLDAGCSNDDPHLCQHGDTLYVSVNSAIDSGYVGAYAEPLDSPTKERIWYLPPEGDSTVNVPHGTGTVVLPYGVRIGPTLPTGRYRITLWLSREPIQRGNPAATRGKDVSSLDSVTVEVRP